MPHLLTMKLNLYTINELIKGSSHLFISADDFIFITMRKTLLGSAKSSYIEQFKPSQRRIFPNDASSKTATAAFPSSRPAINAYTKCLVGYLHSQVSFIWCASRHNVLRYLSGLGSQNNGGLGSSFHLSRMADKIQDAFHQANCLKDRCITKSKELSN